jgi:hypothetical protein
VNNYNRSSWLVLRIKGLQPSSQFLNDMAFERFVIAFVQRSMEIKNPISKIIGIENVVTRKDSPAASVCGMNREGRLPGCDQE